MSSSGNTEDDTHDNVAAENKKSFLITCLQFGRHVKDYWAAEILTEARWTAVSHHVRQRKTDSNNYNVNNNNLNNSSHFVVIKVRTRVVLC